jgi:hydrogenase nickel incorporation protein HypA/HybF
MTHELSLMAGLLRRLDAVSAQEGGAPIVTVRVRLGALAHISPEHFREHFEAAAPGTPAEGAELEVEAATDVAADDAQDIVLVSVDVDG